MLGDHSRLAHDYIVLYAALNATGETAGANTMAPTASHTPGPRQPVPGARAALALLLIINLFNYIDRQVLSAVLPALQLDSSIFDPTDAYLQSKLGLLTSAFLVSYTLLSPVFGWFGGRSHRWFVVGIGVVLWSIASGSSGLATGFAMLLATRCLVGVGEAAYGPVAPSMLSDLFPIDHRGRVMAFFYLAIPVGSALGFVIGGQMEAHFGWRSAFYITYLGIPLGIVCFLMKVGAKAAPSTKAISHSYGAVLRELRTIPSFVYCCLGMTATTFMLGGVAAWAPAYIFQREARFEVTAGTFDTLRGLKTTSGELLVPESVFAKLEPIRDTPAKPFTDFRTELRERLGENDLRQYGDQVFRAATAPGSITLGKITFVFGAIVVVSGLGATLLGGYLGDRFREKGVKGAYFKVAGWTTLAAWPFFVLMLFVPFPYAWAPLFVAVFGLFLNTGPANTVLANVTRSEIRATAFAINILVIHMLGDVISPPLIGFVGDIANLHTAFLITSFAIPIGGLLWVRGARHLDEDTIRVERTMTNG